MGNIRKISKKYYLRQIVTLFLVCCMFCNPVVLAEVVHDSTQAGTINVGLVIPDIDPLLPDTQAMTASDGAIGTFSNFDIAGNLIVNCDQGGINNNALFKVNSTDGTQILGIFNSDGNIYLQDLRGILIGANGEINANSFIASTLAIKNTDWKDFIDGIAEQLPFARGVEDPISNVENQGTITALSNVYLVGSSVINSGTIIAPDLMVMAAGDKVYLKQDSSNVVIDVDIDLNFSPNHVVDNGGSQGTGLGTIEATDGKVILAAGDIWSTAISGVESLRAEATRNITMEGAATATGDIALIADADLQYGGDVTTNGAVSAGGNVDIAGNVIDLNGYVIAGGGDLTITGRTSEGKVLGEFMEGPGSEGYWGYIDVAENQMLYAGDNVVLKDAFGSGGDEPPAGEMDLFGHGWLGIIAEGGSIQTQGPFGEGVKITVEDISSSSLLMEQAGPLNLADYSFGNQNNTEIELHSLNGSVTAVDSSQSLSGKDDNAADQWASITAFAYTDITLQGHDASRDITAGILTSYATGFDTGNITVTSDNSKVLLTDNVSANQGSVAVTAIDGGIVSSGHITASDGITLFGEVTADASVDQIFDAGQGTLWAKDTLSTITKTGTGGLTLSGDTLVDLDGIDGSTGDSVWVKDGFLTITDSVDVEGNLKAKGVIHLQGTTNNVAGDILSTGSGIIIDHDVDADGVGSQTFDAGTGSLIAENEADIDKITAGSLTLAGDAGIELGGNVTGSGMESGDKLTFENNVIADGTGDAQDQRFDAGLGSLDADGSIVKTTDGKLNLGGDEGIELGGNVETYNGDLTLEDAVTANGGDQVFDADGIGTDLIAADDIIKTTAGNLTLGAGTQPDAQIELAGDVTTSNGDLILWDKVIANGTGNQKFDADGTGTDLIADDDILKTTAGNLTLGAGTQPDAEIYLPGDVTTTDGDLTFWDQVIANGSDSQRFDAVGGKLWATDTITKTNTGDLNLGGDDAIDLDGTVDVQTTSGSLTIEDDFSAAADLIASENVTLDGTATLDGSVNQKIEATNGSLYANDSVHKTGTGNLEMFGGYNGPLYPDMDYSVKTKAVTVDEGELSITGNATVRLDGSIYSKGNMTLASNVDGIASTPSQATPSSSPVPYDYLVHYNGTIQSLNGDVDLSAQNSFIALDGGDNPTDAYVSAGGDILLRDYTWVQYSRKLQAGDDVVLAAGKDIHANGSLNVVAGDDILLGISDVDNHWINQDIGSAGNVTADGDLILTAGDDIHAHGQLSTETDSGGNILATAVDDIHLYNTPTSADADGDLTLDAGYDIDVLGDLISNNGSIELSSDVGTTYLGGNVTAAVDITLNNNTVFTSDDDQKVDAQTGTITAKGWLWKNSEWGSLYLEAAGDISLADYVGAYYGGVSIISENGKIFTPDGCGYETDTLNIRVSGYSDDYCGDDGVDLLYGPGKAAIIIASAEDLKLGPDAELIAEGYYDDTTVDDRQGVGFLDEPLTYIGGVMRDEGEPIDVAVYLASTTGNVDVESQEVYVESPGTMVVDAYDTVTLGDMTSEPAIQIPESTSEGRIWNIDRLEVASRITEWLFEAEAFGTLPHPYNPEIVEAFISGDYVLRGAGLNNPDIFDGSAWVLEDPVDPAPLYGEAGEAVDKEEFGEGGCPQLMNWLAVEVGVPAEDIQVALAGALALNTDIQPCEMCARLMGASKTLEDAEGTQIAAMSRVVNEFVTTPAPPSPEQMTQIAAALALHVGDGTYYASAGKWIDALVAYVGIMNSEMGYSASDSAAFAQKYLTPVTETGNVALNAYVQARLAALGG